MSWSVDRIRRVAELKQQGDMVPVGQPMGMYSNDLRPLRVGSGIDGQERYEAEIDDQSPFLAKVRIEFLSLLGDLKLHPPKKPSPTQNTRVMPAFVLIVSLPSPAVGVKALDDTIHQTALKRDLVIAIMYHILNSQIFKDYALRLQEIDPCRLGKELADEVGRYVSTPEFILRSSLDSINDKASIFGHITKPETLAKIFSGVLKPKETTSSLDVPPSNSTYEDRERKSGSELLFSSAATGLNPTPPRSPTHADTKGAHLACPTTVTRSASPSPSVSYVASKAQAGSNGTNARKGKGFDFKPAMAAAGHAMPKPPPVPPEDKPKSWLCC